MAFRRSLRAQYERDVGEGLSRGATLPAVTEADLAVVPSLVRQYLRTSGVVGKPRVANFRVRMHGRIRSGPDARWLPLRAEQYNFVADKQRFFYLRSSMLGVPVRGYHRYADASASMHVKAAGLITVARADGREMFEGETVTLLNDMCLFAPATLLDPALVWEEINARTVRVRLTNAGCTVQGELTFNAAGELTNFVSDDRFQASPDGAQMTRRRWSTPISAYRAFGPAHLMAEGEGRWHTDDGSYTYIELEVDDVDYNVESP